MVAEAVVGYSARDLAVLEGLEAVRKRPGMYIGSSDSRGLVHCLWEIVDNAVDEALGGFCDTITVTLRADGSVEVADDGRGIPVDAEPRTGLAGVELVLTRLHAGGKFGGGSYTATGGLHGVGASVVNALSVRMDVEVDRGGRTWAISFSRGVPGTYADPRTGPDPAAPFTPASGLRQVARVPRARTGTRVRWWSDPQVFTRDAVLDVAEMAERFRQTTSLVAGLRITLADLRDPAAPSEQVFAHDGGIAEFCADLAAEQGDADVSSVWQLTGSGTFTETVPVLDARGHMESRQVERTCEVDVALRWGAGFDTTVRGFVNVVATPKGGTHVAGFEQALLRVLREQVAANAVRLRAGRDRPEKEDALEGLTALVSVRLAEPQFEGQTKEVLGTGPVRGIVADVVRRELEARFGAARGAARTEATAVLEKVVGAMRTRMAARASRDTARRKTALENGALPPKLVDCRTRDVGRSELFVVEGDSAMGTAKAARNADFQALLPIRGKILNVAKASVADMLANNECAALIQVLGAGSGRTFDLAAARYGRVVFMSDADVDGAHIRCLLVTLFFRYLRPLVEAGRVFAAMPPLHRIEVTRPRNGQEKYTYTYSEQEFTDTVRALTRRNLTVKMPPQRYKGLGEMDADQLRDTTMDPARRTLRRITVSDAAAAEATLDLLMGSDVGPRRDFLVDGAAAIDAARLDV